MSNPITTTAAVAMPAIALAFRPDCCPAVIATVDVVARGVESIDDVLEMVEDVKDEIALSVLVLETSCVVRVVAGRLGGDEIIGVDEVAG